MSKFILQFTTTIKGEITVEAESQEKALEYGDQEAQGTLNYDDLTDQGQYAPNVETECVDIYLAPDNKKAIKVE